MEAQQTSFTTLAFREMNIDKELLCLAIVPLIGLRRMKVLLVSIISLTVVVGTYPQ